MPKRKELRGAASGLLGAFVSRNNDVEGYWVLGKLYAHALKADVRFVCVDLLDATVTPPSPEFHEMAAHFGRALASQLGARSIPPDWVKQATIRIEFGRAKSAYGPGDVFNGSVAITDDRGRTHHAQVIGSCWVHDPLRELRSARVRGTNSGPFMRSKYLLSAALVFVVGGYVVGCAPLPFIQSWWVGREAQGNDPLHKAARIADGLVLTDALSGMSRDGVVAMLGAPTATTFFSDWDLVYRLGPERGFIVIDDEWLIIRLDVHGKVQQARVVTD